MDINKRLGIKLDEIAQILLMSPLDNKEIGVLGGISGNALFHFYYAHYKNDNLHYKRGIHLINETLNRINNGFNYPTFCDGLAGAFWTLELLQQERMINCNDDLINSKIDEYLFICMEQDIARNKYDFLHGAIGYGFYFLKRLENSKNFFYKKILKSYLMCLLDYLRDSALNNGGAVFWVTDIKLTEKQLKGCNLGLSHGIPSIINFLSRLLVYEEFNETAKYLLESSITYLLSLKQDSNKYSSSFPNYISEEVDLNFVSRLGWCYGDLGIGLSLLIASDCLHSKEIRIESLDILKKTTNRKNLKEARVKDGGLCHGSFGIVLIYNILYEKTKIPLFKTAKEYWAEESLKLACFGNLNAGYRMFDKNGWTIETNLLEGTAGIGLSLIQYLDQKSVKWSESLLLV